DGRRAGFAALDERDHRAAHAAPPRERIEREPMRRAQLADLLGNSSVDVRGDRRVHDDGRNIHYTRCSVKWIESPEDDAAAKHQGNGSGWSGPTPDSLRPWDSASGCGCSMRRRTSRGWRGVSGVRKCPRRPALRAADRWLRWRRGWQAWSLPR